MKFADYLTYGNLISGFSSILFVAEGLYMYAGLSLLIAFFLDYLDGKVARLLKQETKFGELLDSLADLVSFGVAPAMIAYLIHDLWPVSLIFLGAGAYRLARYNATKGEVKGFEGIPITINGLIFPLLLFTNANIHVYGVVMLLMAWLMPSKIKVPKLK